MRYLVFADVHGNALAFDQFLIDIRHVAHDKLVFLGDFVGYYYDPERIIQYCIEHDVICLLGNHDWNFLQMLDGHVEQDVLVGKYGHSYIRAIQTLSERSVSFLRTLQPVLTVTHPPEASILFCHGSPLDWLNGRIYPDTDLALFRERVAEFDFVIAGHTHHKMARSLEHTTFLNPGSLGQQRDGRGCSYLLLDSSTREFTFRVVSYDITKLEALVDEFDGG